MSYEQIAMTFVLFVFLASAFVYIAGTAYRIGYQAGYSTGLRAANYMRRSHLFDRADWQNDNRDN